MGNEQSRGPRFMTREQQVQANTFPTGLDMDRDSYTANCLTRFSILNPADAEKQLVQDKIFGPNGFDTPGEDRAMGCFLGMPVGDSLGAPLEFSPVRYGSTELKEMGQEDVWYNPRYNRFRLRPGQWTDDASMGLCIADSLLVNQSFNPLDLRLRFLNWWEMGYNNAFGYEKVHEVPADEEHEPEQKDKPEAERTGGGRTSVGLGGNISQSFREFKIKRTEFTTAGDRFTSGNGSVMRLAAVPIYYANEHDTGLDVAYKHSKTTHQGDEAAECCRLMSHIIITAINYPEPGPVPKSILENIPESFASPLYSVSMLAASKQEERHRDNEDTADLANRNWNWKDPNFRFSPQRAKEQPGYIGSYSMDALAMALHCVYTTDNFRDALLKTVNLRGDSDSVGAVAGQIAGAMYGVREIPRNWIEAVQKWDNGGTIALRGYKLYTHHAL